eukprot:23835_1
MAVILYKPCLKSIALYIATIVITCTSSRDTMVDEWVDDYSCNSDGVDKSKWSNCAIIYDNASIPLYHGPYSNSLQHSTLSRTFECKYHSDLNLSFYSKADCSFNEADSLFVSINDVYEEELQFQNALVCNRDQHFDFNVPIRTLEFRITFDIDSVQGTILLSRIRVRCIPHIRNTSWSSIASAAYFSLYVLLLCIIAIGVAIRNEYDGIKEFFKTVWKMRSIYAAVLIHFYDTATDIGVMVDWWLLAQDEASGVNYESVDMTNLFWASVAFLVLYRIISVIMIMKSEESCNISVVLAFFDLIIIRTVWNAFKDDEEEPTPKQRLIQLIESVCESLPQILLQSVFIIRGFNDPNLKTNANVFLVVLSLAASVVSITNKYVWIDASVYDDKWTEANFKVTKCPFVNYRWMLRVLYRFSMVFVRFVVLSLVWVILGGAFLPIYATCSWFYWLIFGMTAIGLQDPSDVILHATFALVSNVLSEGFMVQICRFCENSFLLAILTWFAVVESMNCGICSNSYARQASNNDYVEIFIWGGWIAFVIETVAGFAINLRAAISGTFDDAFHTIVRAYEAPMVSNSEMAFRVYNPMVLSYTIGEYIDDPSKLNVDGTRAQLFNLPLHIDILSVKRFCDEFGYELRDRINTKLHPLQWHENELLQDLECQAQLFSNNILGNGQKYDCLLVFVSSHGSDRDIVSSDYKMIDKVAIHRSFSMHYPASREVPRVFVFDSFSMTYGLTDQTDIPDFTYGFTVPHNTAADVYSYPAVEHVDSDWTADENNPDYRLVLLESENVHLKQGSLLIAQFVEKAIASKNSLLYQLCETIDENKTKLQYTFNNGMRYIQFIETSGSRSNNVCVIL